MQQIGVLGKAEHLARLGERAPERLFAGDADEFGPAGFHQAMNLAHGVEPGEIRHADPHRIDLAGNQHAFERSKRPAWTKLESVGFGGQSFAVRGGRAVHAGNGDMANGNQRLQMKVVDEARADQADPQRGDWRVSVHVSPVCFFSVRLV